MALIEVLNADVDADTGKTIKAALKTLIARARKEKQWLYLPKGDVWLAPGELERRIALNMLLHPVTDWELRDPKERLDELDEEIQLAVKRRENFRVRMSSRG